MSDSRDALVDLIVKQRSMIIFLRRAVVVVSVLFLGALIL